MKRWRWAAGAAAAILLLAAAFFLRVKAITLADEADYQDSAFRYQMENIRTSLLFEYHAPEATKNLQKAVERLSRWFPGDKGFVYNVVILSPDGSVLYKYNENFVPGGKAVIFGNVHGVYLADPEAKNVYSLAVDFSATYLRVAPGGDGAVSRWWGGGVHTGTVAGMINAYSEYFFQDDSSSASDPKPIYALFLFDDATKAYMEGTHTGGIRSSSAQLNALSFATGVLGAIGLVLLVFFAVRAWKAGRAGIASLVMLFQLPVLAGLCAAALLLFPLRAVQEDPRKLEQEKRDEISFLTLAMQTSGYSNSGYYENDRTFYTTDGDVAFVESSGTDSLQNAISSFLFGSNGHYILLLLDKDGKVLAVNDNGDTSQCAYYQLLQNRAFIRWSGKVAWFVYSDVPGLAQKFRAEVYDATDLDGNAPEPGVIGTGFEGAPQSVAGLNALGLEDKGIMRVYCAQDEKGEARYLVELNVEDQTLGTASAPPIRRDTATPSARGMLVAAAAALTAFYWLLLPVWVRIDARRRGRKFNGWTVLTLLTNLAGLALYLAAGYACGGKAIVPAAPAGEAPPKTDDTAGTGEAAQGDREDENNFNFPFGG